MKQNDSIYADELNRTLLAKVVDELFDAEIIQVKQELEGMFTGRAVSVRGTEDDVFFIGPWAGPQSHISNVFHEMAHFAERRLEVLQTFPRNAWGFTFGTPWELLGRSGHEAQTDQAVRCEQRCWAYQLSIQDHYKVEQSDFETASSAVYLDAWCYYQPFEDKIYNSCSSEDNPKLQAFVKETRQMANTTHTWEHFLEAWNYRIQQLKEYKHARTHSCGV